MKRTFGWLLPRTLRSRLIWLVFIAVLLTQAMTLYALTVYQRQEWQSATTNLLVTSITTLKSALLTIPTDERAAFVTLASKGQWLLLPNKPPTRARYLSAQDPSSAIDGRGHAMRHGLMRLSLHINQGLGHRNQMAVSAGPTPFLYVSLGDQGSAPWLRIPLDRISPPITTSMMVWWLLALVVLLLVAVWFSWHITRPIIGLVKATDQLAEGHPQPVIPAGPFETQRLGERFNAMLQSLRQSRQVQQTLLAGLPHDLKGPLSRMALRIEMSEDEELKAGLGRDLKDMQRMVEQFLDFLRGQDTDRLVMKPVRLDQWLPQQILDEQQLGKPITVKAKGALPPLPIKGDSAALSRLLANLIDNALSHGKPPVVIDLYRQNAEVVLSVGDHGLGIAPVDYSRATEPFERLDEARTRTGSVGLGLSLVKGLALAHGGRIELSQAPEGGLLVLVFFPLDTASDAQKR
jgi:two-component system osmolarity sensor histidine kinase EnvZ